MDLKVLQYTAKLHMTQNTFPKLGMDLILKLSRYGHVLVTACPDPEDSKDTPYDWVIYLGGTNDLACRITPESIFKISTKSILALPLTHGAKVLIMTIPECESQLLDQDRKELNEMIKEWGRDTEGVWEFDLWKEMKYPRNLREETDVVERNKIWDDNLHFTPKGYEMIGEMLGKRLVKILQDGEEGEKK